MNSRRRNHYDVANRVRVSHPQDVHAEIERLLLAVHPDTDGKALATTFDTFGRLFTGALPGYVGCDTWYHDAQHSLDAALATARLIDGHERGVIDAERLGARRALLGIVIALFHDAGYIRRDGDRAGNGAEYTLSHVRRSGEFLAAFLPRIGYAAEAQLAARIVHFTGYEMKLDDIDVREPKDRRLGFLIGSADLLAQTADRCYLEKCRDFLYPEFEICGLAGPARAGGPKPLYRNRRDLINGTPEFNRRLWEDRLDGYFGSVHRYFGTHFRGRYGAANPYIESIRNNLARVTRAIRERRPESLSRRPQVIGAAQLRNILGLKAKASRQPVQRGLAGTVRTT